MTPQICKTIRGILQGGAVVDISEGGGGGSSSSSSKIGLGVNAEELTCIDILSCLMNRMQDKICIRTCNKIT